MQILLPFLATFFLLMQNTRPQKAVEKLDDKLPQILTILIILRKKPGSHGTRVCPASSCLFGTLCLIFIEVVFESKLTLSFGPHQKSSHRSLTNISCVAFEGCPITVSYCAIKMRINHESHWIKYRNIGSGKERRADEGEAKTDTGSRLKYANQIKMERERNRFVDIGDYSLAGCPANGFIDATAIGKLM